MQQRILVVEDNEEHLYLLTFLLEHSGYEVLTARNGREAVEKAEVEKPDLILMDLQLPEMDGCEATRRIKAFSGTRTIPVLAISAHALAKNREEALAAGCASFIEKPILPETFIPQIQKYLKGPSAN